MKSAQKMKLERTKKTTEPRKEKHGPRLKAERTSETNTREKEGNGRRVKSKMDVSCQERIMDDDVDDEWDGDLDNEVHYGQD